jgi:prolyl-tRNA editing enzyme YbaK/EbsC (Cys-tRNA(Pro) deacylase)
VSTPELSVLSRLREWIEREGIQHEVFHHQPTRTSVESAKARGEKLSNGGKALLLKVDKEFQLFVMPADRRLDSRAVRGELGARRIRFASADELLESTGLVPGSVPPFGEPLLPFPLNLDEEITKNERIAFNAGSLELSFRMKVEDYLSLAQPKRVFKLSS